MNLSQSTYDLDQKTLYDAQQGYLLPGKPVRANSVSTVISRGVPAYHTFSLWLFLFWASLICLEIYILEKSVALATTAVTLPWLYRPNGAATILNIDYFVV